jgi:hypothetical protein
MLMAVVCIGEGRRLSVEVGWECVRERERENGILCSLCQNEDALVSLIYAMAKILCSY